MLLSASKTDDNLRWVLKTTYRLFSVEQRKAIIFITSIALFVSLLEVSTLALFLPVLSLAQNPDLINSQSIYRTIYNLFQVKDMNTYLFLLMVIILICFVFKNITTVFLQQKQFRFAYSVAEKLSARVYTKYMSIGFTNVKQSEMLRDVLYVPRGFTTGVLQSLASLITELLVTSLVIIGVVLYNPLCFLLIIITLGPTTVLIYWKFRTSASSIGHEMNLSEPKVHSILAQVFFGYDDLVLANKRQYFLNKFKSINKLVHELLAKNNIIAIVPGKFIETIAISGIVMVAGYVAFIDNSTELVSLIGLYGLAAYRLMPSATRVIMALNGLNRSKSDIIILRDLLLIENNRSNITDEITKLEFMNCFELKNIHYAYAARSNNAIIRGINLKIKSGEKLGIIGESGSGKSTLMNIMLRFIQETDGMFLVDDKKLESTDIKKWHNNIGYVKQSAFIFDASVRENIAIGVAQPSDERIWEVLRFASLHDFIQSLPKQLDTPLGENGVLISGGQKQRIAIARALYRNPRVLFMDEATSALDSETERDIADAIDKLMHSDLTIVTIAHRYTTLRSCSRIIELADGKIQRSLTYKDLQDINV